MPDWRSDSELASAVLDALTASICVVDQSGTVVAVNEAWRKFANDNDGKDAFIGANYLEVCRRAKGVGVEAAHRFGRMVEDVLKGRCERFEIEYPCHGPQVRRWFLARVTRLGVSDCGAASQVAAVITHQDVTARKLLEFELKRLAETDELTGLKNRRRFLKGATRALERLKRSNMPSSLCIIDLDHFMSINDKHGHAVGDEALCHVVRGFKRAVRRRDLLARIGGEEFAVLLPNTDEWGAIMLADRIRGIIAMSPLETRSLRVELTVSIGVTEMRQADGSPEDAIGRADSALYRAKNEGRNLVRTAEQRRDKIVDALERELTCHETSEGVVLG